MPDVRQILLSEFSSITDKRVAVMLSGGIDSLACCFALQELGHEIAAYTFMLDNRMSTDFARARAAAKRFSFDFHPVFLPRDVELLKRDMLYLKELGAKKKTDYECGWPCIRLIREVREKVIVTGHGADGLFCISKKGMIHWKDRIDEFRSGLFSNPNYAQRPILEKAAEAVGKTIIVPFLNRPMIDAFIGTTWDEINRPKQKQPILDSYPQFKTIRNLPHTNLQLGDSGIANHFFSLLETDWNTRSSKSPVAIYNDVTKGLLAA